MYTDTVRTTWQHPNDDRFVNSAPITDCLCIEDVLYLRCQAINLISDERNFHKEDIAANINKGALCTLLSKALARAGLENIVTYYLSGEGF